MDDSNLLTVSLDGGNMAPKAEEGWMLAEVMESLRFRIRALEKRVKDLEEAHQPLRGEWGPTDGGPEPF
jgi:hypothetical protein